MYKVVVYAISKNESKHVKRWVESMKEADEIYVLDTGSTDDTVKLLKELGVNVFKKEINPWRFDVARNESLKLVPNDTDICVCTDLDEVFHKDWRKNVEKAWGENVTRLKYRYTWSFTEDGKEGSVFYITKIHARHNYKWHHPVHEILVSDNEIIKEAVGVQLDHHQDRTKPREYLKLLELAVKEDPFDDRNMHYLGREYMYFKMWNKCEETLKKHLAMPKAVWKDERAASMRYIALSLLKQGRKNEAFEYYMKAIIEAPYLRDTWLDMAEFMLEEGNFEGVLYFTNEALKIKTRSKTYINSYRSFSAKPYDLMALSSYYLNDYNRALINGLKALEYEPNNERLLKNLEFYKDKFKDNNLKKE